MSWSTLAPNGVFYQSPKANCWRDPDIPCSWIVHWPATCKDEGSSDQVMHLPSYSSQSPQIMSTSRQSNTKLARQPSHTKTPFGLRTRSSRHRQPLVWQDDEIVETSTTIEEAEHAIGGTLRKASGSRMPSVHRRTDSGSTQSSATLASIPDASAQVRTFSAWRVSRSHCACDERRALTGCSFSGRAIDLGI